MTLDSFLHRSMIGAKCFFYGSLFFLVFSSASNYFINIAFVLFVISFSLATVSISIPTFIKILRLCKKGLSLLIFNKTEFNELLDDFIYTQGDVSSAEEILEKSTKILSQIKKIQRTKFLGILPEDMEYYRYIITYCHNILIDMKLDLTQNIKIYLKKLENSQSEIAQYQSIKHKEKNLSCESTKFDNQIEQYEALRKISELQSARLDRQIRQFEELQKVLVKI